LEAQVRILVQEDQVAGGERGRHDEIGCEQGGDGFHESGQK